MTLPDSKRPARQAQSELQVLVRCEEFASWFFQRTTRWPKHARFTVTQRLQSHTLDALDELVTARFDRANRADALLTLAARLQRMRYLLRLAASIEVCPRRTFEAAVRALDEIARMVHGWRQRLEPAT